ncbi:MAG: 30S ribosomal protein S6 [Eubacteriales bacterium]|nr:30S ribosomal protein S6 [Clostridiales bacterium]MDY5836998.1 30S ribosomal protein S6 [Eubacteriales bacterium]
MARNYELLYVLNPTLGEEGLAAMDERIQGLISANGEIKDVDVWGVRRLAYEIQDLNEGYYVVLHFTAEADFPVELERQLKINDKVLRFLVTSMEE